jgi:DNA-binding XRE family transcriptional regulator
MDDTIQIIRDAKGEAAFAVMPWPEYERLHEAGNKDARLIALADAARDDERFPADVASRLVAGEATLKVIREWRGLTQGALGERAGVATQYISQIERRARNMGKKTAAKLGAALQVSAAMLRD